MIRALLGGTFDPVHDGHVALVDRLLADRLAERVTVAPAARSPHKEAPAAPADERLAMVRLAFADRPRVAVDDRELHRSGPSYTVDTLRALAAEHPADRWRLVVGADQLAAFPRWREAGALLGLAELLVFAREGCAAAPPPGVDPARVRVVADFAAPVSSTAIRAMVAAGRDPVPGLPPAVAAHIRARGLYRS